jgi:hypothetical protein
MKNENYKYFVYALLDPRKKGNYKYTGIRFEYEPFYVGKGSGNRISQHYTLRDMSNKNKNFTIDILNSLGYKPLYKKIYLTDDENEAYEAESLFIYTIGTIKSNTGPLLNIGNPLYNKYASDTKSKKLSIDFTEDMYKEIMDFAFDKKIYKFGPTVIFIIREYLKGIV